MSEARFRFKGRATGSDPTGYYHLRWDRAQNVSVIATTKAEASGKARQVLGPHPRFGGRGKSGWAIIWDRIDEEPATADQTIEGESND